MAGKPGARDVKRSSDVKRPPTPSPPKTTTTVTHLAGPTTPVRIPVKQDSRAKAHPQQPRRHHGSSRRRHQQQPDPRRPGDVHSPDDIPPSVAALLAITTIPPPKGMRPSRHQLRCRREDNCMTVESIIERSQESEKELSLTLSGSPLDLLLAAPEDLDTDDHSVCESNTDSTTSIRTVSFDSAPSLDESLITQTPSSIDTPLSYRSRKARPTRRTLEPVPSPLGGSAAHPLSPPHGVDVDELDFRVFDGSPAADSDKSQSGFPFRPLRSAFKSNLTASLRVLRQAARSFSSLNFPSIPPEDFLTRSILAIDPQVPFTDERRPPPLDEEPNAAMRRYLNPTTRARMEQPVLAAPSGPSSRSYTASIQMQTYKVHRPRLSSLPGSRLPRSPGVPVLRPGSPDNADAREEEEKSTMATTPLQVAMPGPRQREMRENSDFIRVAVMEMAMRKRGKLDDQRPGRARWALPPRRVSSRPYEIGADGVPTRWVAVSY